MEGSLKGLISENSIRKEISRWSLEGLAKYIAKHSKDSFLKDALMRKKENNMGSSKRKNENSRFKNNTKFL